MQRFLVLVLVTSALTLAPALRADAPQVPGFDVHQNLTYATPDGTPLALDVYVPQGATKPLPLLVWVHGGAWKYGDKVDPFAFPFLKTGFVVASINYRFSQQAAYPAQLYDCKAAIRWLRAHAADYNIDPTRVAVGGASAGGHLAALVGTTSGHPELEGDEGNPTQSSAVQAVCDFYGPADFQNWVIGGKKETVEDPNNDAAKLIGGSVLAHPDKARAASPVTFVTAKTCPFFIAHGDQDNVVPLQQSQELDGALRKAGASSTLDVVPGAGHAFQNDEPYDRAIAFLKQQLGS